MATYAIGDVQGCFATFKQLLRTIDFDSSRDHLWLVGDLVNRGPRSLDMLRWAYDHENDITVVLGNHDLHLLAAAQGHRKLKRLDTLQEILDARDSEMLLEWLQHRPVLHVEGKDVLVHAGLLPGWSIDDAQDHAETLERALRNGNGKKVLRGLQEPAPDRWSDGLKKSERLAFVAAVFTRMRVVGKKDALDDSFAGTLDDVPKGMVPWFRAPDRRSSKYRVVFGHWSALGLYLEDGVCGLDTGCVWGRELTALRLEDNTVFTEPYCEDHDAPEIGSD